MFLLPINHRRAHFAQAIDRLFDDATFDRIAAPRSQARSPALDVAETEQAYTVTLDMPGVAKDNVKISIEGRRVSVQADNSVAAAASNNADPTAAADQPEAERLLYRERAAISYARSFVLPLEVEQATSSARLDQGVLTLQLAKRSASKAAQLTVN